MSYFCMQKENYLAVKYISIQWPLLKKTIEPCQKHNKKCNGFNGFNGNYIGFNGKYNGVYRYVMDSIGGTLNLIGKMPKTHYKKNIL